MQGLVLTKPAGEVVKNAIEEGLLCVVAEGNVIRLLPPLIAEKEHIDEMIQKLTKALEK